MNVRFPVVRRFSFLTVGIAAILWSPQASYAAIGPVADIELVNAAVRPDGVNRPYALVH
jgi:hypothetical protein